MVKCSCWWVQVEEDYSGRQGHYDEVQMGAVGWWMVRMANLLAVVHRQVGTGAG